MNADDLRDRQIENYIHNRMNAEERSRFEKLLLADTVLKSEINELLEIKMVFDSGLVDFKKKLIKAENKLEQENFFDEGRIISLKKTKNYWWAIAASVILITGVYYFYYSKPDLKRLAMNATQNDFSQLRGSGNELDSLFELSAYQQLIDKATQQLITTVPRGEKVRLSIYIARSYILLNLPVEAIKHVEGLDEELRKNCDLQYTLALANLSMKEKIKAKSILNKIIKSKCFPQELHASELLNYL